MIRPCSRSLVQDSGFRVQGSGFRVQSSGFRVFSIHKQLTSLEPTMLQEPPVCIHNRCTIDVHNSSSMTHYRLPSILPPSMVSLSSLMTHNQQSILPPQPAIPSLQST